MTTATQILNQAKKWLGYSEANGKFKEIIDVYNSHKPLARGYKLKYSDEWCDGFVSALFIKLKATELSGTEVGVDKHIAIFKQKGIWLGKTSSPKAGDIIVFDWDGNGSADHIGIVEKVEKGYITTIEGNYNEVVARRKILVGWDMIKGFARPKYTKETASDKPPYKKVTEHIVNDVIAGKYGNGKTREKKLAEAGYNYDEVQATVNKKLSAKPSSKPKFNKGDKAKVMRAVSYDGVKIDAWVLNRTFLVIEASGNRIVLGNGLNTAFNASDLKKV